MMYRILSWKNPIFPFQFEFKREIRMGLAAIFIAGIVASFKWLTEILD
jgi:hypothetical protein